MDFSRAQAFWRGSEASVQRLSAFGSRFVAQRDERTCFVNLSPVNPQLTRRRGVPISLRKYDAKADFADFAIGYAAAPGGVVIKKDGIFGRKAFPAPDRRSSRSSGCILL